MLSNSQNYINNKELVSKLLGFVDFNEAPLVIEIGPGKGIITDELIKKTSRVIAIEADQKLAHFLKGRYTNTQKLQIVQEDILKYNLPKEPFLIVSNLPFNITADIVRKITAPDSKLKSAYLILQKEAAIKFLGAPHAHSPLLSHFLQINFSIEQLMLIPSSNYSPRPKFDTAFVSFSRKSSPVFEGAQAEQFKDFLVYIFERRKPLIKDALKSIMSNLQVKIALEKLGIPQDRNIKKVLFNEWVQIFNTFLIHTPEKSKKTIARAYQKLLEEQSGLKKEHRTRRDF